MLVWETGQVVWIPAQEIEIRDLPEKQPAPQTRHVGDGLLLQSFPNRLRLVATGAEAKLHPICLRFRGHLQRHVPDGAGDPAQAFGAFTA